MKIIYVSLPDSLWHMGVSLLLQADVDEMEERPYAFTDNLLFSV